MLRTKRSFAAEQRERERKRALVIEAAHQKKDEELGDQLLSDIIAAVPRTTPKLINEVVAKVKAHDDIEADLLQAALDQSTMLKINLDGMDPSQLWSEPVRDLWQETIGVLTQQTSRWKVTPLCMVHPFYGKVAVCLSLCGKCRPQNEYERMRLFRCSLRDGLEHLVESIHPVMDEKVGKSLPKEETREILLDVSQEMQRRGELSEESDECSEDESDNDNNGDNNGDEFRRYDEAVEIVTNDWTKDRPDPKARPRLTTTPSQSSPSAPPSPSPAESTFDSPLHGYESASPAKVSTVTKVPTLTSGTSSPLMNRRRSQSDGPILNISDAKYGMLPRAPVSRTLFPTPQIAPPVAPERLVFTPTTSTVIEEPTASPILKSASESGIDLSRGYSIIPYQPEPKRRSPKKKRNPDAEKGRSKKRPVSSPNLPNAKMNVRSRKEDLDRTSKAVQLLQVQQANQSDILQRVADQMNQLTYSMMELNSRHQQ